jgi:hypothetical protein
MKRTGRPVSCKAASTERAAPYSLALGGLASYARILVFGKDSLWGYSLMQIKVVRACRWQNCITRCRVQANIAVGTTSRGSLIR